MAERIEYQQSESLISKDMQPREVLNESILVNPLNKVGESDNISTFDIVAATEVLELPLVDTLENFQGLCNFIIEKQLRGKVPPFFEIRKSVAREEKMGKKDPKQVRWEERVQDWEKANKEKLEEHPMYVRAKVIEEADNK